MKGLRERLGASSGMSIIKRAVTLPFDARMAQRILELGRPLYSQGVAEIRENYASMGLPAPSLQEETRFAVRHMLVEDPSLEALANRYMSDPRRVYTVDSAWDAMASLPVLATEKILNQKRKMAVNLRELVKQAKAGSFARVDSTNL